MPPKHPNDILITVLNEGGETHIYTGVASRTLEIIGLLVQQANREDPPVTHRQAKQIGLAMSKALLQNNDEGGS